MSIALTDFVPDAASPQPIMPVQWRPARRRTGRFRALVRVAAERLRASREVIAISVEPVWFILAVLFALLLAGWFLPTGTVPNPPPAELRFVL